MTASITSEETRNECKKLSYVGSPFCNLEKWIDNFKDNPEKLNTFHDNFSLNARNYLIDRKALAVQEPRKSDENSGSVFCNPRRCDDDEWTKVFLTLEFKAADGAKKHSHVSSVLAKFVERENIFAEIEQLEYGVSLEIANDRINLLRQLFRDVASFNNESQKLTTQKTHSYQYESVDPKHPELFLCKKYFDIEDMCNTHDQTASFLELFWWVILSLLDDCKFSDIHQFCIAEPALLSCLLLAEILNECKIKATVSKENAPDPIISAEDFTGKNVPMIVFANADLNAALDAATNAAWFTEGLVPWATSCILVQESVHSIFISSLKTRLQKSVETVSTLHTSLNIDNHYQENIDSVLQVAKENNLEVFKVTPPKEECQPATLVIGDFLSCLITHTSRSVNKTLPILFVVPFRKIEEGLTMANSSVDKLAASVWSESFSQCLSAVSQLNFGTVWVNSYGMFDSLVPFFSRGPGCEPYCPTGIDYYHWNKSLAYFGSVLLTENQAVSDTEVQKCLTSAHKAYLSWVQKDLHDCMKFLDHAWKYIEAKHVPLRKQLVDALCGKVPSSGAAQAKNCLVSSTIEPVGVVIFIVESKKVSKQQLLKFVLSAVFSKNSVIVSGDKIDLSALKSSLPENVVNFTGKFPWENLCSLVRKHKLGANMSVWILDEDYVKLCAHWDGDLLKYYKFRPDVDIRPHVVRRKCVWMPLS